MPEGTATDYDDDEDDGDGGGDDDGPVRDRLDGLLELLELASGGGRASHQTLLKTVNQLFLRWSRIAAQVEY